MNTGVHTKTASAVQYSFKLNRLICHKFYHCFKINLSILINIHLFMWFSLFQRCQKQNNRYFNIRGYKGPRKLKTANINPHVFGANPRKFGDTKIYHFTVLLLKWLLYGLLKTFPLGMVALQTIHCQRIAGQEYLRLQYTNTKCSGFQICIY